MSEEDLLFDLYEQFKRWLDLYDRMTQHSPSYLKTKEAHQQLDNIKNRLASLSDELMTENFRLGLRRKIEKNKKS